MNASMLKYSKTNALHRSRCNDFSRVRLAAHATVTKKFIAIGIDFAPVVVVVAAG